MKNNSIRSKIGIIGGAGPMAGVQLLQKIVQICQEKYGCKEDADFPYLVLLSYPFTDMLNNPDQEQKAQITQQLNSCLDQLLQMGIDSAAIACNTLHEFLDTTVDSKLQLVNMIRKTAERVRECQLSETIVLCSTTSSQCKLHKRYFDCSYPVDKLQGEIQVLIDIVLAGCQSLSDSEKLTRHLNELFIQRNSEQKVGLILGCTELSGLNDQFPLQKCGLDEGFTILDPIQIVAEEVCALIFRTKGTKGT